MAQELHVLRRIGVYVEPNGSYNVANATYSDFVPVPFKSGSEKVEYTQEMFDPQTASTRIDFASEKVLGQKRAKLGFSIPLQSHGQDCDGNTATIPTSAQWPLRTLLTPIMGSATATTAVAVQTVVQASSTTTVVKLLNSTHSARFSTGMVIGCEVSSTNAGRIELREVASVAGSDVTVTEAFSAAPVTGTPVRGGISFALAEDSSTTRSSIQAVVEGVDSADRLQLRGLQASSVKLSLPLSGIPEISFDLAGAGWSRLSSTTVSQPTFTYTSSTSIIPANFSELTYTTFGSSVRNRVDQSKFDVEIPAIAYKPISSGAASDGILTMARQKSQVPVKCSFDTLFSSALTWETAQAALTDYVFYYQVGNTPGGSMLISIRLGQVVDVKQSASEGVNGFGVSVDGRMPSTSTTALIATPVAIHFV